MALADSAAFVRLDVAIYGIETDAVMDIERISVIVAKAVVYLIGEGGAVDDFHPSGIVILVETLGAMANSQAAIELDMVRSAIATQLESIGIAAILNSRKVLTLKATGIYTQCTWVLRQIELGTPIVIGDAVDIDGRSTIGYALIRVPPVVAITPGAAAYIHIARTGIALLIGKAVGIATLVLIIEVIMRVAVYHRVVTATAQLYAAIATAVHIEMLQYAVLGALEPDALLAGIADGDIANVQILTAHLDAVRAKSLTSEIDDGLGAIGRRNRYHVRGIALALNLQGRSEVVLPIGKIKYIASLQFADGCSQIIARRNGIFGSRSHVRRDDSKDES